MTSLGADLFVSQNNSSEGFLPRGPPLPPLHPQKPQWPSDQSNPKPKSVEVEQTWILFVAAGNAPSVTAMQIAPSFVQLIDIHKSGKPPWLRGVPTLYCRDANGVQSYEGSSALTQLEVLTAAMPETASGPEFQPANKSLGFEIPKLNGNAENDNRYLGGGKLSETERDQYMQRRNMKPSLVGKNNVPSYMGDGTMLTM